MLLLLLLMFLFKLIIKIKSLPLLDFLVFDKIYPSMIIKILIFIFYFFDFHDFLFDFDVFKIYCYAFGFLNFLDYAVYIYDIVNHDLEFITTSEYDSNNRIYLCKCSLRIEPLLLAFLVDKSRDLLFF